MGILRWLAGEESFDGKRISKPCPYCGVSSFPESIPYEKRWEEHRVLNLYWQAERATQGGVARSGAQWYNFACWDAVLNGSHPPAVSGAWCCKCMGKVDRNSSNWEWIRRDIWIEPVHKGRCPDRANRDYV